MNYYLLQGANGNASTYDIVGEQDALFSAGL